MDGTVLVPLLPEIGNSQTGRQESEETGSWVTPLQTAANLSAAAAYIDEVVWKAQDAQVVERLEGCIGGRPSASLIASSVSRSSAGLRRAVRKALPSAEGRGATMQVQKVRSNGR